MKYFRARPDLVVEFRYVRRGVISTDPKGLAPLEDVVYYEPREVFPECDLCGRVGCLGECDYNGD